jgi:hypothetical protein
MSYRNREPSDYRSDRPEFDNSRPDQYGQDPYGRGQFGQSRYDQQRGGWDQQHHGWQPGEHQRTDRGGRDSGGWRGREHYDWRGRGEPREDFSGRESQDYQARTSRDRHPLSQEPMGHEPFTHSAFGQSESPRYFGTGAQGHGGGPSFTGGTYGTADWRSDSPYFDEVGFNRGNYEDPLPRQQGRAQRRYPLGPKGYTRSDERLREDISERLMQAYHIDSSEVTVQVQGGKVVLEGTVPNRYMKHAIEDIADAAPGVQDVDNRMRVVTGSSRWSTTSDAGSLATNATSNTMTSGTSNQSFTNAAPGGTPSARTPASRRDS